MTQPDRNGHPSESLATALALIQTKLPKIEKTQTATVRSEKGSYTYDYADLSDVSEQILPILGDAGLSWTCRPTLNDKGDFVLAYKLLHISGECEVGEYPLPKSGTPQTIGGHITYARRYALCAMTGVAPKGDDDDGAAASASGQPRAAQRRAAPRQQAAAQENDRPGTRTAQRAAQPAQSPPLPGEAGYDEQGGTQPMTTKQRGTVMALFGEHGIEDRDERLDITRRMVGRAELESTNRLTAAEASQVIKKLQQAGQHEAGFSGYLAELLTATEDQQPTTTERTD